MACRNCGQDYGHHDSMHCPYTAIKLFGVRITNAPNIPKSASTGNLPHLGQNDVNAGASETCLVRKSASAGNLSHLAGGNDDGGGLDGYTSDGLLQTRRSILTSHPHEFKNKGSKAFHGPKKNTDFFCWDSKNWGRGNGEGFHAVMCEQEHLFKWLVMLRNFSSVIVIQT